MSESLDEQLEALIDKHSVLDILVSLELLCEEKRLHILANWQDKVTAAPWHKASIECGKAARKVEC